MHALGVNNSFNRILLYKSTILESTLVSDIKKFTNCDFGWFFSDFWVIFSQSGEFSLNKTHYFSIKYIKWHKKKISTAIFGDFSEIFGRFYIFCKFLVTLMNFHSIKSTILASTIVSDIKKNFHMQFKAIFSNFGQFLGNFKVILHIL